MPGLPGPPRAIGFVADVAKLVPPFTGVAMDWRNYYAAAEKREREAVYTNATARQRQGLAFPPLARPRARRIQFTSGSAKRANGGAP